MARRKVNRSNLVREAFGQGITKPSAIVEFIQKEHGVVVTTGLIHKLKSSEKIKQRKKPGRKPGPRPQAIAASANGTAGTLTLQDITTVKGLLVRLGRNVVQELIAALV